MAGWRLINRGCSINENRIAKSKTQREKVVCMTVDISARETHPFDQWRNDRLIEYKLSTAILSRNINI